MHVAQGGSPQWMVIDEALTRLAASKGALDVEIGRWLLVARREGVQRPLGFGSFAEYVERRLGYDSRTTAERLRVARALEALPVIEGLLRTGARCWTAVRELTRVATPDNEAAWVEASERMTVRQVEALVAGREPGDDPWDARDPVLTPHRLVLELPAHELAEWQEAAESVRREIGPAATNREVLRALVQKELGGRPESRPGYQTAVTVCAHCERAWQRAGSELVEVAAEVGDCARCDGEVVGVVEVEAATGDAGEHVGGARSGRAGGRGRVGRADVDESRTARLGMAHADELRTAHGGRADVDESRTAHVGTNNADEVRTAHVGRADVDESRTAHVGTNDADQLRTARVGTADADELRAAHVGTPDADESRTAHVGTPPADAPTLAHLLHRLLRKPGRRVLTRVMSHVIGAPPTTMTPRLRAAVRTRDHGRCVVPGCRNFRFVDVHHLQPRAAGGPHTLENVVTLCTQHHRAVHEGVLAIEVRPDGRREVRHASGAWYGAAPTARASG